MNFVPLWFHLILCARLRLAHGDGIGRSVLNNPHLWHSNWHFFLL